MISCRTSGPERFYPEAGIDWYRSYSLRLAGVQQQASLDRALRTVIEGVERGLDNRRVISNLREVFPRFSKARLETIARTEIAKIYEQARIQEMGGNDDIVGYEFAAILDTRTSDICREHNGRRFPKGKVEGHAPPLHYSCRSVLLPIFRWEVEDGSVTLAPVPKSVPKPVDGFGTTAMEIPEVRDKDAERLIRKLEGREMGSAAAAASRAGKRRAKMLGAPTEPAAEDRRIAVAAQRLKDLGIEQLGFRGSSKWGAAIASKAQQAEHLELIADELDRMRKVYPNMPRNHTQFLHVVDSPRGYAIVPALAGDSATRELSIRAKEIGQTWWRQTPLWEQMHGVPRTVYQEGNVRKDNLRHEVAHNLSTSATIDEWRDLRLQRHYTLGWFRQHVSDYAGKDAFEALAETFTVVTRANYQIGSLPSEIEDFIRLRMLGG